MKIHNRFFFQIQGGGGYLMVHIIYWVGILCIFDDILGNLGEVIILYKHW